jgi:hypothetical protein
MRPIPIVSYEEPGSSISHLTFSAGADSDALPANTLYYVARSGQKVTVLWADDSGHKGVVQV